jgi:hypothetical protein
MGHWVQGSAPAAHRAGDLIEPPGFDAVRKNGTRLEVDWVVGGGVACDWDAHAIRALVRRYDVA